MARGSIFQNFSVLGDIVVAVLPIGFLSTNGSNVWMPFFIIKESRADSNFFAEVNEGVAVEGLVGVFFGADSSISCSKVHGKPGEEFIERKVGLRVS